MSNLDRLFYQPIYNSLTTLLAQKKFDSDTSLDIYQSMKRAMQDLQEAQIAELETKIRKWEEVADGADTTLYTLGLRHAIDIIKGEVATDSNGYDGQPYVKEEKGSGEDEAFQI